MHSWSIQKCRFAILFFIISVGNFMLMTNIRNRNSESFITYDLEEHEITRSGREYPPRAIRAYLHDDTLHVESLELNHLEAILLNYVGRWKLNRRYVALGASEDDIEDDDDACVPYEEWQKEVYPSCNSFHEVDFTNDLTTILINTSGGSYRSVWKVADAFNSSIAVKTLQMTRSFSQSNLDGQRLDAIISEKLTSSNYISDIYGYCAFSASYEFSYDGGLDDHYMHLDKEDRLKVATMVARGVADLHSLGKHPIIHDDISARQFIKVGQIFKLNDFNCARPPLMDAKDNELCLTLKTPPAPKDQDRNRAPEENLYREENVVVDEKIDIYSMGNIFYKLLMNKRKYQYIDAIKAHSLMMAGKLPDLGKSTHFVDETLKHAIQMCLKRYPADRASATEIEQFLTTSLQQIGISD